MYDELVKRLRASCESCKLWDGYKCCLKGECSAQTRLQAADAIEDLSAAVEGYESSTNMVLVEKDGETVIEFQPKWIPVTERLPSDFVGVQAHMADAENFPPVREAYVVNKNWFFPALKGFHPVDMWKRFDEPPKEEAT